MELVQGASYRNTARVIASHSCGSRHQARDSSWKERTFYLEGQTPPAFPRGNRILRDRCTAGNLRRLFSITTTPFPPDADTGCGDNTKKRTYNQWSLHIYAAFLKTLRESFTVGFGRASVPKDFIRSDPKIPQTRNIFLVWEI